MKEKEEVLIIEPILPSVPVGLSPEDQREFRIRMERFTARLNQEPVAVEKHQGYLYVPISFVEKDLFKQFFGLVQYEVLSYTSIFNEVACHARIKVFHPVINQWLNYDGVGSAVIQQDANTKIIDFQLFKKPNALQLTLPKAYAEAIKNAAKKIGKRYGADLNRKIEDDYEGQYKIEVPSDEDLEAIKNSNHAK